MTIGGPFRGVQIGLVVLVSSILGSILAGVVTHAVLDVLVIIPGLISRR